MLRRRWLLLLLHPRVLWWVRAVVAQTATAEVVVVRWRMLLRLLLRLSAPCRRRRRALGRAAGCAVVVRRMRRVGCRGALRPAAVSALRDRVAASGWRVARVLGRGRWRMRWRGLRPVSTSVASRLLCLLLRVALGRRGRLLWLVRVTAVVVAVGSRG